MKSPGAVIVTLMFLAFAASSCVTSRQISSANTNLCMNVPWHGFPIAGTPVNVKACDPWNNQQWTLDKGRIVGEGGFCLDVQGSVPVDGAAIVYVPCTGAPSQHWTALNDAIVGIGGKCIDVASAAPVNGARLVIASCNSSATQEWSLH